ncbi:MAG: hypothetical protein HN478_02500, partial [Rhodospirillaceae bacterium]|nr:hypothetical protein [Rhodospirillaceae bacterium]
KVINLPSKISYPLEKGDILVIRTGGGAGYGEPGERAAGDVERDLRDGFMSGGALHAAADAAD